MQAVEDSGRLGLRQSSADQRPKKANLAAISSNDSKGNGISNKTTANSLISSQNEQVSNQAISANAKKPKRAQEEDDEFKNTWKKSSESIK